MRKPRSVGHELHSEILNRWCNGESGRAISKATNVSKKTVSLIVVKARQRGDFRAIHHYYPDGRKAGGLIVGRYGAPHRRPQPTPATVHSLIAITGEI